jgi:hypothetical protein
MEHIKFKDIRLEEVEWLDLGQERDRWTVLVDSVISIKAP